MENILQIQSKYATTEQNKRVEVVLLTILVRRPINLLSVLRCISESNILLTVDDVDVKVLP